jgi:hypothetical protein
VLVGEDEVLALRLKVGLQDALGGRGHCRRSPCLDAWAGGSGRVGGVAQTLTQARAKVNSRALYFPQSRMARAAPRL